MLHVQPAFAAVLGQLGITDAAAVFSDPRIRVWRSIRERENATLDAAVDGRSIRFHIKRDKFRQSLPSSTEARQMLALRSLGIATANLVAHGALPDGRTFVITEHLEGYDAADNLIRAGAPFERLLGPTAALAGRLHAGGAFHRDLYLCHFLSTPDGSDVRLIDCARVLINPVCKSRWRVKDLAQVAYSLRSLPVEPEQFERWLVEYARVAGPISGWMRRRVDRKADRIARHDARLRERHPERSVSIS